MKRLKVTAWSVAAAAFAVGASVAANQVYDHRLHWTWAYLAFLLTVLPGIYGQSSSRAEPAPAALRGRRAVYLRQLRAHVRDMETTGLATQGEYILRLRQVYVDVSLRPATPQDTTAAPYVGQSGAAEGQRKTLKSFLDEGGKGRVFAVIGGPGSGKTTLMRATAGDLCHGWRPGRLPVLLYLRDHAAAITADPEIGLAEVAARASWVSGRTPASWIEARLKGARCLVMLDGLDEVADQAERIAVVTWVRRQIDRYPGNDYLLTSRPHGYQSNPLPRAEVLQVRRFTAEQISRFLHSWYYAIQCRSTGVTGDRTRAASDLKADDLLGRLRSRPALYDLAANPLLLTMIANVHRYRGALPAGRADLYTEMCDVLVHRRQESKNLPDLTRLTGAQKKHVMGVLALTMMDARLRDIPADQAGTAIRAALRGVSPDLAPADFLREVNRSGLLIEREHDRYAFAHLTLQEYLAASQIGPDAGHLPEKVDDPWWRETTLLWAANFDATPVITACLASGTVRALALAFMCADEARTVDHTIRRELDRLLDDPDERVSDERRRLITAIVAAGSLREVIWLREDTPMCARPIDRALYALFVHSEKTSGRHTPMGGEDGDDRPVTGLWAGDVSRFVAWLNGLFDDDTAYRLPTEDELTDSAIGLLVDPAQHTIWRQTADGVRLHRPDRARWPYAVDPERLRRYPVNDREPATPLLQWALSAFTDEPDQGDLLQDYERALLAALMYVPTSEGPQETVLVDIRNLAVARALDRLLVPDRDFPYEDPLHRSRALDRARKLDDVIGAERDYTDRDALNRVVVTATEGVFGENTPRLHNPGRARARAIGGILLYKLGEVRGRYHIRVQPGDVPLPPLTIPPFHGIPPGGSRGGFAELLVDLHNLHPELDFALDLALGRLGTRALDGVGERVACSAFRQLLMHWVPESKKFKPGAALADFDTFLKNVHSQIPGMNPIPEDPSIPLSVLRGMPKPFPQGIQALIEDLWQLITRVLDRSVPVDLTELSYARLGLLAVAVELRDARESDAAALAIGAIHSLAALQEQALSYLAPNDVLLLVRT